MYQEPRHRRLFVIAALMVLAFVALYAFRGHDDNRLTSWEWAFRGSRFGVVLALLVPLLFIVGAAGRSSRVAHFEERPALLLFLISFCAVLPFWQEPEVIVDTARYFTQAKYLALYGAGYFLEEWGRTIPAWTDLPLVPFLYGLLFKLFGEARLSIQLFTTLLFSSTVVLTYRIGATLWSREVGLFGGLLLLGMPYLLTQVPLMLVDVPTMALFTAAVSTFIIALRRGGRWILFASAALFAALLSKYSTWPLLSLPVVAAALHLAPSVQGAASLRRATLLGRAAGVFALTGLLVALVVVLKREVFAEQVRLLLSYQGPGLRRWGESFASTFLFQIHPFLTGAALCSLVVALRRKDAVYAIIGWPVALAVLLNIQRIRYLIPVFPFLALMAAYAIASLRERMTKRFIVLAIAASSLAVASAGYLPFLTGLSYMNLKQAGAFADRLETSAVEVITLPATAETVVNPAVNVPLFDLFTKKNIHYTPPPLPADLGERKTVSPLRFTWEYRNPPYYARPQRNGAAVAVIAGEADAPLPEHILGKIRGMRNSRSFALPDDIFLHKTYLTIYY